MFNVKLAATLVVALMMFSGAAVMVGTEDNDATGTGGIISDVGYNNYGQLGTGDKVNKTTITQIGATYGPIVDVACSDETAFFITQDGRLFGMGHNNYGQLGDSTLADVVVPTQIGTFTNVSTVVCSNETTFFITQDGRLFGMGHNNYGQLGDSTLADVVVPTQIGTFTNVSSVVCSTLTTFFITQDGEMYGMGRNANGQLGTGDTNDITIPTQLVSTYGSISKVICTNINTLFITSEGDLYGMGNSNNGQLKTLNLKVTSPRQISTGVSDVKTDGYNTFFLKNGELYGCGYNSTGELGQNNTTQKDTLVQIGADKGTVVYFEPSLFFKTSDGKVYATGSNDYGQKGVNSTSNLLVPTEIVTQFNEVDKIINNGNTTVILADDGLYVMGRNTSGYLGIDTSGANVLVPTQIAVDLGNILDVAKSKLSIYLISETPTATVTVTPNDSDYGTVSPASITDIEPGDTITVANNTITYGETVVTATPAEADAQYTYAFSGFVDSNSDPVTGTVTVNSDMTITAVFTATTNQYSVTISPNDPSYGSISPSSLTVDYGTAITVSGTSLTIGSQAITATASDATAQYTYAFDSWTVPGAVETVTGPITITGVFTATVNEYTVTIESADVTLGTVDVSEVQDVPYGTAITVSGDTITIGDTTITATVIGDGLVTKWSVSDGATVTGDMTITASFVEPSSIENTLMGMLPFLLIIVLVITAAGGVFASGGNPEDLIKLIICLAVGVIIISVFVLPIAGGL